MSESTGQSTPGSTPLERIEEERGTAKQDLGTDFRDEEAGKVRTEQEPAEFDEAAGQEAERGDTLEGGAPGVSVGPGESR